MMCACTGKSINIEAVCKEWECVKCACVISRRNGAKGLYNKQRAIWLSSHIPWTANIGARTQTRNRVGFVSSVTMRIKKINQLNKTRKDTQTLTLAHAHTHTNEHTHTQINTHTNKHTHTRTSLSCALPRHRVARAQWSIPYIHTYHEPISLISYGDMIIIHTYTHTHAQAYAHTQPRTCTQRYTHINTHTNTNTP